MTERYIVDALQEYEERNPVVGYSWGDMILYICDEIIEALAKVHSEDEETLCERLADDDDSLSEELLEDDDVLFEKVIELIDEDVDPYKAADKVVKEYLKENSN